MHKKPHEHFDTMAHCSEHLRKGSPVFGAASFLRLRVARKEILEGPCTDAPPSCQGPSSQTHAGGHYSDCFLLYTSSVPSCKDSQTRHSHLPRQEVSNPLFDRWKSWPSEKVACVRACVKGEIQYKAESPGFSSCSLLRGPYWCEIVSLFH